MSTETDPSPKTGGHLLLDLCHYGVYFRVLQGAIWRTERQGIRKANGAFRNLRPTIHVEEGRLLQKRAPLHLNAGTDLLVACLRVDDQC